MADRPRSCLRLFFSADIAGSTAYKNRKSHRVKGRPAWLPLYESFFREFGQRCVEKWEALNGNGKNPAQVWKLAGDEILLEQETSSLEDALHAVRAFRDALRSYQEDIRTKFDQSLGLKGTIWCAGFPVINSEVEIVRPLTNGNSQVVRDFIGPSIDAGFRLARHSTPARIVVSPEVAWLLAKLAMVKCEVSPLGIYYDGDVELKGILSGAPVPLFTLDASDPLEAVRNQLSGRKPSEASQISAFVEAFVASIGAPEIMALPYMGFEWGEIPPAHDEDFRQLVEQWEFEQSKDLQSGTNELDLPEIRLKSESAGLSVGS